GRHREDPHVLRPQETRRSVEGSGLRKGMAMSSDNEMSRRDELEALLPFYLNGTLDGRDLAAVEEWLATDPAASVALEEAEAEFSGTSAANDAIRPPADALSRFSKALDAEAGPVRAVAPSALSRLLAQFMTIP